MSKELRVMSKDFTAVVLVKVPSEAELRKKKIATTDGTAATIDILQALCDENREVHISEAEIQLLAGLYAKLQDVEFFTCLADAFEDLAVVDFWMRAHAVVRVLEPTKRQQAWAAAWANHERESVGIDETPWSRVLLSFVRRENLLYHGYRIISQRRPQNSSLLQ